MSTDKQGYRMARAFGLAELPTVLVHTPRGLPMTLAEVIVPASRGGLSEPMAADDAFLLMSHLRPQDDLRLWRGETVSRRLRVSEKGIVLVDMHSPSTLSWTQPLHAIVAYLPRRAIFEGSEQPAERYSLNAEGLMDDGLLASIMGCLGHTLLAAEARGYGLFVRHTLLAACSHLSRCYAVEVEQPRVSSALTGDQQAIATEIMRRHVDAGIAMGEVARACGLAHGVFVQAFKHAFGTSPHDWFTARRLERAVELMHDRSLRLVDIAVMVGFADQSHFNRAFSRFMACPPGVWRREALGKGRELA